MKYFLIGLLFLIPSFCFADVDQSVPATIATIARASGVLDPQTALFLTVSESKWDAKAVGDTHLTCKIKTSPNYGKPMKSRGVWQINDCSHPEVSASQAFDVVWSTNWAMDTMAKDGGCRQWSTCKLLALSTE